MSPAFSLVRLTAVLSDEDRSVWEEISVTTARHPSETDGFLATRLLAWCLRWEPGIAWSGGVSSVDEPALSVRGPDGAVRAWIEVGLPDPDRIHKASKRADRVSLFPHRPSAAWRERCRASRIHRADTIEVVEIDPVFVDWVAGRVGSRGRWDVWIAAGELRIAIDGADRATHPRVTRLAE